MPGFGYGSFGQSFFGSFDWSRRVLFESAPELYRTADLEQGELFRKYTEAQGESFDNLRFKIANFATLRSPRAVRTRYDETQLLRLGKIEPIRGAVEQGGVIASVSATSVFTALRARFTQADVGKELTITGSVVATNNTSVVVTNALSPTELLTNPPLSLDAGPFRWELRALETSLQRRTLVTVIAGDVAAITPGWVVSDGYTDFVVLKRQQFKLASDERKLLTQAVGTDGSLLSGSRFSSPTLGLTSKDVGRKLTISASLNPYVNNGKFEIVDVLSSTICLLDSAAVIAESTGALVWALLRDPTITLEGMATLRGPVEQQGEDGEISTAVTFTAGSAQFSITDVGKLLTIHKPGNADNGVYTVVTVTSATEVVLDGVLTTFVASGVHWELRSPTIIGDETQVEAHAPDLLQYLAEDFGISLDTREEEEWQRRWVESVSRWVDLKGHSDTYKYLAELTGFTAVVSALYRVSQELYLTALAAGARVFDVGEEGEGRYGIDGSLEVVGGRVRFSSPTAAFENWDVGRCISVEGTAGATNDGLRTIAFVIDSQTVEFRPFDVMVGAVDAQNGFLIWRVVRLYADQAPTLPVHDEIDGDRMTYLKTANVFTVDKFCWEQNPAPWSTLLGAGDGRIEVDAVSPPAASAFPTSYTVTGRGDFGVVQGLGVGRWKLTDGSAVGHFLETVPRFRVLASGTDGTLVNVLGVPTFSQVSGTLLASYVGKMLVIEGAGIPENNQAFRLDTLVSVQSMSLDASHVLLVVDPNNGALRWTIYDCEQSGGDGSLTLAGPSRFTSPTAAFLAASEGKALVVSESLSGNSRQFLLDTLVSPTEMDLDLADTPTTPDANNGALVWFVLSYQFEVVATTPPVLGTATLEYICPEQQSCAYCRSNKVLIEATTPYLLEKGFERLHDRLAQCTPKHVELVESFGLELNAGLMLTASVDSP